LDTITAVKMANMPILRFRLNVLSLFMVKFSRLKVYFSRLLSVTASLILLIRGAFFILLIGR
jgi:hypothetical protein